MADPLDPDRFIERAEEFEHEAIRLEEAGECALENEFYDTAEALFSEASDLSERAATYRRTATAIREVRQ